MKYYQLGHSGLIVSELAFGAMTFGSGDYYGFKYTVGQQEANDMIAKAIDKSTFLIRPYPMRGANPR